MATEGEDSKYDEVQDDGLPTPSTIEQVLSLYLYTETEDILSSIYGFREQ